MGYFSDQKNILEIIKHINHYKSYIVIIHYTIK